MTLNLSDSQLEIALAALDHKCFLEGLSGTGKTTAAVGRLIHLLKTGSWPDSILVIIPQSSLTQPYYHALRQSGIASADGVTIVTMYAIARRMIDLFWPLLSKDAGFANPNQPPTFLTIETSQYFMSKLVAPLLLEGYFDGITINPNRLYSQILDSLNKAAVIGFPYTDFGERLSRAWIGEQTQRRVYAQAQDCANRFRKYCLENNLLDFSLQMEIFSEQLWHLPVFRDHIEGEYQHLIFDNIEEDAPVIHDLVLDWLPSFDSALFIYDSEGGYRSFRGADPISAMRLKSACDEVRLFSESFTISPDLNAFASSLAGAMKRSSESVKGNPIGAVTHVTKRYFPELLDWTVSEIARLVHEESVPPGKIVILAPFMPDVLRFSLQTRLETHGIPFHTHRPSRPLKDEPAARTLFTLSSLAHPGWRLRTNKYDVAYALMNALDGLDLVRAHLLTDAVYIPTAGEVPLQPFEKLSVEIQERVTFVLGQRYEFLRSWLERYAAGPPTELDHFLARIFGEVISQPGFGFHSDIDAGTTAARLIESIQKFRWVVQEPLLNEGMSPGREYMEMVDQGVIAAQHIAGGRLEAPDAVLISPASTFLMGNRPVDFQFWINVGSNDWWRRIHQPLTHPFVLSRHWPAGQVWEDNHEFEANLASLYRLTQGLIRRCRKHIYLGINDFGPYGYEQRGPLLRAAHRVFQAQAEVGDV